MSPCVLRVCLFSAYAEVFPRRRARGVRRCTFLCLRRGVSVRCPHPPIQRDFSLPTQRCFWIPVGKGLLDTLFSAYAEVFPFYSQSKRAPPPFLCLRRGVSYAEEGATLEWVFSLPTQRCFRYEGETRPAPDLFSAYAEVFPSRTARAKRSRSFLCLRRGVSPGYRKSDRIAPLFSAYAEVFPVTAVLPAVSKNFSLPTQRCFLVVKRIREINALFSAYAEVFLSQIALSMMMLTFLCLRRGVSHQKREKGRRLIFSLPTQRCFRLFLTP